MNNVEIVDNFIGMSLTVPSNWKVLNKEELSQNVSLNTIFIVYTDSNDMIQAVYDGKCLDSDFDKAYNLNIENMKKSGVSILSESSLILQLQNGIKNFKQAVVEYSIDGNLFRVLQLYTIINGIFLVFSVTLDKNIDVNNLDLFNNQKSVLDLINVLSSIKEFNSNEIVSDESEINEDVLFSISNVNDYSNIIPEISLVKKLSQYCFGVSQAFIKECEDDEKRNEPFKFDLRQYRYKKVYSTGCTIRVTNRDYKSSEFKDLDSFLSAIDNGIINNLNSLHIKLYLDYKKGNGNNLVEHENQFEIIFKPYDISFVRKSNYNEVYMNEIELRINEIMKSFNCINTIFCSK